MTKKPSPFIGREAELIELKRFTKKTTASMIVVRGRRRIGKSRLIQEFGKQFDHFYTFIGLAPTPETTTEHQLGEFNRQIAQQFQTPQPNYNDWSDALWAVGQRLELGKTLLLFDEISWMGSKDPTFLGKIKNFWDLHLKKNDQLIFVICGSASSWIEKNILSNTGFLGRISYTLTLEEIALSDCSFFWGNKSLYISAYEKLKVLSVTGGVPKYLEEIDFNLSAEENIRNLCFKKGGFLVHEFENIFSDLFLRDSLFYREIVEILVSGPKEAQEICDQLNVEQTGRISEYLRELELSGFVKRDYTWDVKSGHDSKLSKYRLCDNYMRFYLKYIAKYRTKIDRNSFATRSLGSLSELNTILGLQFENLVLNNRKEVHRILGLQAEDIISENPFFQRATTKQLGCQIDYMIQSRFNTLYICEIKFWQDKIGSSIIEEVRKKIDRLNLPRGYSLRPVLIHVNGVDCAVEEEGFFASIIDFGSLLR
jgi:AAA+ ATPase superfamily predicted ATPase